MTAQPLILSSLPSAARALRWRLRPGSDPAAVLDLLAKVEPEREVLGLGSSFVAQLGAVIPGLREFSTPIGAKVSLPSSPGDFWLWLHDEDRGRLVHRTLDWQGRFSETARLQNVVDLFTHEKIRDLSGYEDGTENPVGEAASTAAVLKGAGEGLDGSSFVAVQRFEHDLKHLRSLPATARDDIFGRRLADNEEFESAPLSAHVKRAAQESFTPEAFMVRRSMPWAEATAAGLLFVAFGCSFDAYEAVLKRMVGAEDGVVDGLFQFTTPLDAAFYWCPPVRAGRVDLGVLRSA